MKKLLSLTFALLFACLTAGCGAQTKKYSESFDAMDTFMQVDVYGDEQAMKDIKAEITRLDGLLSTTGEDSDVSKRNKTGSATADEAVLGLAEKSLDLCRDTGGALDITVYPIVEEWGFISKDYKIPDKKTLSDLLQLVDHNKVAVKDGRITLLQGAKLDFGAVAKGYAADRAKAILDSSQSDSALLNLGGTVLAYGEKEGGKKWKIGIADPKNSAGYMGYITCKDKIIATSGSYERCFTGDDGKIYSHIIDPKTGVPVDNGIESVTIISDSGALSDALSTALFVMGREEAERYHKKAHGGFNYIILTSDKKAYVSGGISESFTVADGYDYELIVL